MKRIHYLLASLALCTSVANTQVEPNSNRFDIENYIALDNTGNYYPYTAHGFYENVPTGSTARIFILPILKLDLDQIKYIDTKGHETYQSDDSIRTIIIPVMQDLVLPNESQKAAIAAAIGGQTAIQAFYPPIAKNPAGFPLVTPLVMGNQILMNQLMTIANNYEMSAVVSQQNLINEYNTRYNAQLVSLTELEVIVEVGDEVIYTKRVPKATWVASGGSLTKISLDYPSEYVKNMIADGNAQILISYKFKDSKGSFINAHIDATAIVDQYLNEYYRSSVSQSSSGWSFLGFGSSSKSMKTSFDQQVTQQYTANSIANTTIEMYDADDQMIKQFESIFFPSLSQQEAIQNHINAAEKAGLEGKNALQDLHLKYVEMLQQNNPNLTPNIEAAVAALGKNDYVGFIANGVRIGSNSVTGTNTYRRVLNSNEMSSMAQNYSQAKVISIQHAVTQPVTVKEEVNFKATLGSIEAIPFQNSLYMSDGFNVMMQNVNGVLVGPITANGALHKNNIYAGTLITKIGSYPVYSAQTVTDALGHYEPGEVINLTLIVPSNVGPNCYQEQRVQITLGTYPKMN